MFRKTEVLGQKALFIDLRIDRDSIPTGIEAYDVRADDDFEDAASIARSVFVNYWGTVLVHDKIKALEKDEVSLGGDGMWFTDDREVSFSDGEKWLRS